MSIAKQLERTHGGQWVLIRVTRRGIVWINNQRKTATRSFAGSLVVVKEATCES